MKTCEWTPIAGKDGEDLEMVTGYRTGCGAKTLAPAGKAMAGTVCPVCLRRIRIGKDTAK